MPSLLIDTSPPVPQFTDGFNTPLMNGAGGFAKALLQAPMLQQQAAAAKAQQQRAQAQQDLQNLWHGEEFARQNSRDQVADIFKNDELSNQASEKNRELDTEAAAEKAKAGYETTQADTDAKAEADAEDQSTPWQLHEGKDKDGNPVQHIWRTGEDGSLEMFDPTTNSIKRIEAGLPGPPDAPPAAPAASPAAGSSPMGSPTAWDGAAMGGIASVPAVMGLRKVFGGSAAPAPGDAALDADAAGPGADAADATADPAEAGADAESAAPVADAVATPTAASRVGSVLGGASRVASRAAGPLAIAATGAELAASGNAAVRRDLNPADGPPLDVLRQYASGEKGIRPSMWERAGLDVGSLPETGTDHPPYPFNGTAGPKMLAMEQSHIAEASQALRGSIPETDPNKAAHIATFEQLAQTDPAKAQLYLAGIYKALSSPRATRAAGAVGDVFARPKGTVVR